jgi:hypothetical protein
MPSAAALLVATPPAHRSPASSSPPVADVTVAYSVRRTDAPPLGVSR